MRATSVLDQIQAAFANELTKAGTSLELIEQYPNLMEIPGTATDLMNCVPVYLQWCARHPGDTSLTTDWTVNALAEFGRSHSPQDASLDFRFRCTPEQRQAVVSFLEWCLRDDPFLQKKQIERALRNWNASTTSQP